MATVRDVKRPEELKRITLRELRNDYLSLGEQYTRILKFNDLLCPSCGRVKAATTTNFYKNRNYIHGFFPVCIECVFREAEQIELPTDPPKESKLSVQRVLRMMDRPYLEAVYMGCVKAFNEQSSEDGKQKKMPFQRYMQQINSLPNYRDMTWDNSEFVERFNGIVETVEVVTDKEQIIARGRKRFGAYTPEELFELENAYEDWVHRYPAEAKGQEVLFEHLCITDLRARKIAKEGGDPKDAIKTLQDIMTSLGIKPSQSTADALTDSKSFGELIKAWEIERPIPEPEDEWKDVDRIGLLIDVFFKGHLVKMLNIKNAFSSIYERFIGKYTVKRPDLTENAETEEIFNKIFGEEMTKDFSEAEDDS